MRERILGQIVALVPLLAVPALIGYALDRRLGTAPWATLVLSFTGALLATVIAMRLTLNRYDAIAPRGEREDN